MGPKKIQLYIMHDQVCVNVYVASSVWAHTHKQTGGQGKSVNTVFVKEYETMMCYEGVE